MVEDLNLAAIFLDSCAFGCARKQGFCNIYKASSKLDLSPIDVRCPGRGQVHQSIRLLLAGAVSGMGWVYPMLYRTQEAISGSGRWAGSPGGAERPTLKVLTQKWSRAGYITLLEQRTYAALLKQRIHRREHGRFNVALDNRVTLLSGATGRSPSQAFGKRWLHMLSFHIAGRLFPGFHFYATRLNVWDGPFRQRKLGISWREIHGFFKDIDEGSCLTWDRWIRAALNGRVGAAWAILTPLLLDSRLDREYQFAGLEFDAIFCFLGENPRRRALISTRVPLHTSSSVALQPETL